MFEALKNLIAPAEPEAPPVYRRITIPYFCDGPWSKAGAIVKLINYTDERASWIPELLERSEPCAPVSDRFCTTFDVGPLDPQPMDFSVRDKIYLDQLLAERNWTYEQFVRATRMGFPEGGVAYEGRYDEMGVFRATGETRVFNHIAQRQIKDWDAAYQAVEVRGA